MIISEVSEFFRLFNSHLGESFLFFSLFWIVHGINQLCGQKLNIFGIIPRHPASIIFGPICAPFLHADFNHLLYNSFPLFFMLAILFAKGPSQAIATILAMNLLTGLITWLIARRGNHIGASGLIMALFGFLLYKGYQSPSVESIIIALIILYYFGTLLLSIFPDDLLTSYEGHLAGLIAGIVIAHYGIPYSIQTIAIKPAYYLNIMAATLFR